MGGAEAAPYTRIVAEIRRRITVGELSAGERVPSTRELTREWGVAMATATKALTVLRLEGLVRAVPGVGTVVAAAVPVEPVATRPAMRPRSGTEAALSPESIVAAAVAIADAEGIAAVSMRRVAADLGVATMSLYRHVSDKDDLVLQMQDRVMLENPFPAEPPAGWRARLELAARMFWGTCRRHPWLAGQVALTRPQATRGGLAFSEWMLAALGDLGLDMPTVLNTYILLFTYVRGTAINLEYEADAEAATGLNSDEWMDTQLASLRAILSGGGFPWMERVTTIDFDLDLDALFETGLGYLLDGLAARIAAAAG
ncbi:TetR/AcrR family transcriptional regulator C-terminal domain-containing protein [Pseudonocardia sp. GCM10023141]|uniref:TetR/AcrR family transcriptional regulator C-terminal domain-containing protein n=1 Tax=Pseudonocardia sp. GCM10023141 TaxID=3252653 RepID=UPI00360F2D46